VTIAASTISESTPLVGASPGAALSRLWWRAFQLRGRASRSEYWWWMLLNLTVVGATQLLIPGLLTGRTPQPSLMLGPFGSWLFADIPLLTLTDTDAPSSPVAAGFLLFTGIWMLVTLVPGFTVAVRRLHDSNLSGWWVLLVLVPVGTFVLLLLATRRSRSEGARFD
jgi:uncharacterized membrane protein YhaH (DUF805 family)